MVYLNLPETHQERRLSFYLAMEEFVARTTTDDDSFWMWQVAPSVIFGRNQVIASEVNIDYCKEHGINVYRRKSGGGCVYADYDNIMLSYVTNGDNVGLAFNNFIQMVLLVLRKMGVEAVGTMHNDILIGDKKVSGTACYHLEGRSIVHGTLLYDTDMENMVKAITPPVEKLQKRGIQSVRQRITLLKDHVTLSLDEVKSMIKDVLCQDERMVSNDDLKKIEQLESEYLTREFINKL